MKTLNTAFASALVLASLGTVADAQSITSNCRVTDTAVTCLRIVNNEITSVEIRGVEADEIRAARIAEREADSQRSIDFAVERIVAIVDDEKLAGLSNSLAAQGLILTRATSN